MKTTIDSAGRIVIPKALRDELDLGAGGDVEVEVRDGCIEITVPPTPMRLERRGGGVVAVADREMPPLGPEEVRATLERVRR